MRTFQLPNVVRSGLAVGCLSLAATSSIVAAEPASSVSFVDRDALTATDNGWRNPLRTGSVSGGEEASTNSLRGNVTPVSYDEEVGANSRAPGGLQLRPHNKSGGVFSSMMGESSNAFSKPKKPAVAAEQPQFRKAQAAAQMSQTSQVQSPKSAAQQALGMMPSFQSSAARKQAQAAAKAQAAAARAGSARGTSETSRSPQTAAQRPVAQPGSPASYNSAAAAAQNYRPQATLAAATSATRRPPVNAPSTQTPQRERQNVASLSRPTLASPRPTAGSRPTTATPQRIETARATATNNVDATTPAAILTRAHELSATARTEKDFTNIFSLCQQVPARTATAEETAFGRQLAAWALNRRGQLEARTGNQEAAMSDFNLAVRIDSKCWRAMHNRGVLLAQSGQFEPAFDDFHQTIELNPGFAKAYANRGALYVLAGELEPALADYQQAAELDPKFALAERGCGRTCHMLGRIDEALDHLNRAVELAPRDAAAVASRADLLTDMGEYEAAASDYDQAIALQPNLADAHRGSAWLLATCPDGTVRNPDVALERAQKAVELERKADASTFDTLAAAQASVGDFQAASETLRHAIELAPPSERSVYQDRLQLYRQSKAYVIEPLSQVQQAGYEQ
jgi:tetratricopeptide (TPR) repeat protein